MGIVRKIISTVYFSIIGILVLVAMYISYTKTPERFFAILGILMFLALGKFILKKKE